MSLPCSDCQLAGGQAAHAYGIRRPNSCVSRSPGFRRKGIPHSMPRSTALRDTSASRSDIVAQAERRAAMQPADRQEAADEGLNQEADSLIPQPAQSVSKSAAQKQGLLGQASLFSCALLWGTSAPAMRYLFLQGESQAPAPSLVAAVQTTGAAVCLVLLDAASRKWDEPAKASNESSYNHTAGPTVEPSSAAWPINLLLTATQTNVNAAGFEIGLWAFVANCLTITGFENTTTSRGTFLIRLSAMFTPIVAAAVGEAITLPVWLGCLAAFSGGVLISADGSSSQAGADSFLNLSLGDAYIIIAAVLWSVQTVRMGKHAPKFKPIQLAKFQLVTMSLFSTLWFAKDTIAATSEGIALDSLWGGYNQALNWGVLLIPAIGPWSIGVSLQAKGQSTISSSLSMIILATDPLWAILFAGLVGGNEQHLGSLGWVGALAILSASVIASFGKR